MQIFIEQYLPKTVITMEVDYYSETLLDIAKKLLKRQNYDEKFARATVFMWAGKKLSLDHTFEQEKIPREAKLYQILDSGLWEALEQTDPISLEPIERPYRLNPGCNHVVEAKSLLTWMNTQKQQDIPLSCPYEDCDIPIDSCHIQRLG